MERIQQSWGCLSIIFILRLVMKINGQNYEVYNIRCHDVNSPGGAEILTAILKRPDGFRGHPIFADNRNIRTAADEECQIREDKTNPSNTVYRLKITDYTRCPVERRNEFVMVRVWFPQLDGIVMVDDQDVIIRCKPPLAVVTEHKATAFSGSMPPTGRVSGAVEGDPGELKYTIGLYQESTPRSNNFDMTVEDIVPIGTMLQLRANINNKSAWKYAKLLEVTVSEDAEDPHTKGHIILVKNGYWVTIVDVAIDRLQYLLLSPNQQEAKLMKILQYLQPISCRLKEYDTIVPHQPRRPADNTAQVMVEFQAFLLDNMASTGKLWIHAQIKACLEATDCLAEFCLDLYQPSGHGRKKRDQYNSTTNNSLISRLKRTTKDSQSIDDNIGITVSIPGMEKNNTKFEASGRCTSLLALIGILGILVTLSSALAGILYRHIQQLRTKSKHIHPIYSSHPAPSVVGTKKVKMVVGNDEQEATKGIYQKFKPHCQSTQKLKTNK